VRPFVIERLVMAFEDIEGFPVITVTETEGFGRSLKHTREDILNPFRRVKRIAIAAPDEMVEQSVTAMRENGHTGKLGDGLILAVPLDNSILI